MYLCADGVWDRAMAQYYASHTLTLLDLLVDTRRGDMTWYEQFSSATMTVADPRVTSL